MSEPLLNVLLNVKDLGTFFDVSSFNEFSNKPYTSIIQLSRRPLKGSLISFSEPYNLPIGKFYDVYSGVLFCGTLFEIPIRYKYRLEYNNFCIYTKLKQYSNVRACIKNDRWSCFVPGDNSSLIVVSNMIENLDIKN